MFRSAVNNGSRKGDELVSGRLGLPVDSSPGIPGFPVVRVRVLPGVVGQGYLPIAPVDITPHPQEHE